MLCARSEALLDAGPASRWWPGAGQARSSCAVRADVSSPQDVERLARERFDVFPQVHVLVNNAGVYGPMGPIEEVDWAEWARAMEINVYGSVLPMSGAAAAFQAAPLRQDRPALGWWRDQSAAAHQRLRRVEGGDRPLRRVAGARSEDVGIDVNAHRAGALNTRMMDELLAAGPDAVGRGFYERMKKTPRQGGTPLERGAALAVFLGSAASDGITGRLLSAPSGIRGSSSPEHRDDLDASDVYTLRRIVPEDRGSRLGRQVTSASGVAIVGCGLIGRKRAAALAGRASRGVRRPRSQARADALAAAHAGRERGPELAGCRRSVPTSTS